MSYVTWIVRRTAQTIPVLLGLSVLVFAITRVLPGDPVRLALGPQASDEAVAQTRAELGLDQPIHVQYLEWLSGFVRGEWGQSLRTGNDVFNDVVATLPATLELILASLIFAILIGIPSGMIAGINKDRLPDHISRLIAFFGVSLPRFWVAIMFQVILVGQLDLFPLSGRLSRDMTPPPSITNLYLVDSLITGQLDVFVDALMHITLPAIALSLATLVQVMRLIRSEVAETRNEDYILAAGAYGLPKTLIEYKYILKNSFSSSLTLLGLEFGALFGSAFLVEIVFSWPGIGSYGVFAVTEGDFNAIVGVTILTGLAFVGANLLVDILYGTLDPRIRLERGE